MHPYLLLSAPHRPQPAASSILLPYPTNEFSVLYSTTTRLVSQQRLKSRTSSPNSNLMASLSLMPISIITILSKFLPVLMTNIPYILSQTHQSYLICTIASMTILSLMITTLLLSIIIMGKWPYLPSDPRTIAGGMYYLLNSSFYEPDQDSSSQSDPQSSQSIPTPQNESSRFNAAARSKDFTGLGHLPQQERDKRITDLNYRYTYGELLPTNSDPKSNSPSTSEGGATQPQKATAKLPKMGIYIEPAPECSDAPSTPRRER